MGLIGFYRDLKYYMIRYSGLVNPLNYMLCDKSFA
jgi:hypothetical protein